MSLLPTILAVWFAAGLLVVLLVGARGIVHDLWCLAVGPRAGVGTGTTSGAPPES